MADEYDVIIVGSGAGRVLAPAAQPDDRAGNHTPHHCSAPYASYRSTSVKPSLAARRIERSLAVWVDSTTGSPGCAPANRSSAAAHASAAYPCPHAAGRNR
ncbi:hypothetical protein SAMN04515669_3202 [Jiangella sp. DSM 45060]|nr:hypothetical protein SAMN04515669_3202 [Jiangella sp. DSM 45060]